MRRLFGTDGIRGIFEKDLTLNLANRLGKAAAYVIGDNKKMKAVVGRDTRYSGEALSKALIDGLTSQGVEVIDLAIIPTPAIAFAIKKYQADMGIMISASHNPKEYNGIKLFNKDGYKIADTLEENIEKYILEDEVPSSNNQGSYCLKNETIDEYVVFLASYYHGDNKMKIVVDCANGSASVTAPKLFDKLGFKTIILNSQYDGYNINEHCGSTHLEPLTNEVIRQKADLGIAYDGDADRCLMVASDGTVIDGDYILAICAKDMRDNHKLKKNTLVGTVMSNLGLVKFCEKENINFVTTKVGDRYVLEEMLKNDYVIGGEQSGHVIFRDVYNTGDGQLTSIKVLNILSENQKDLLQMATLMKKYPQALVNVNVTKEGKEQYAIDPDIQTLISKYEDILGISGRLLVRASGTENLIRVMIEGQDETLIKQYAADIANLIKKKYGG